jgi:hypothetical protein
MLRDAACRTVWDEDRTKGARRNARRRAEATRLDYGGLFDEYSPRKWLRRIPYRHWDGARWLLQRTVSR